MVTDCIEGLKVSYIEDWSSIEESRPLDTSRFRVSREDYSKR